MVRVFAVCAVILAAPLASAQSIAPAAIRPQAPISEPTIAVAETPSISACNEHSCPASNVARAANDANDKHTQLKHKLAEMNCLQSEIDALRAATGTPQAVLVKIKVVEVSRTALAKLGADVDVPARMIDEELLQSLCENNCAKIISEPNLAVVCGRPATFEVGGEVPIPAVPGAGKQVEFIKYGTSVDLMAIAQGENRVRMEVRARVSELDEGRGGVVGGIRIPAFNVRQVSTAFETEIGKTVGLSGAVERRVETRKIDNGTTVQVPHDIELVFLITTEHHTDHPRGEGGAGGQYRTAQSKPEVDPAERSLKVTRPYTPR